MRHQKYKWLLLAIFITMLSCKKSFLEVPDKSFISRQAYVTDLKTAGDYLNGIYISLAVYFTNNTGLTYAEVVSDNIKPKTGSVVFANCYSWNQQADGKKNSILGAFDLNTNGAWITGYSLIRSCSFAIDAANKYRSENQQQADNYMGQAYAIRAYTHLMLVNIFAQSFAYTTDGSHQGIPYVTTDDWSATVKRQSVAEVYKNLISDLQNAIRLLPEAQAVPSGFRNARVNRNAAKALLARVHLYKGDWLAAKNIAKEVLTAVPLMTTPNYPANLFTNNETEALFQLAPSNSAAPNSAGNYATNFSANWFSGSGYQLVATKDVSDIIKENPLDVRNVWVQFNAGLGNWDIKKFPTGVIPGFSNPARSYFQTILRSSEMYLTAAECYANLNNRDSAIYFLDAIRQRAWSTAPPTAATGTALLDSIYKERRKELAFEGWRMFDIQRLKKEVNRIDAPIPTATTLPYGSDKAIAPIPASDVQLLGLPQNNGY